MESYRVHALYRYPVKSLGGEALSEAYPGGRGLTDDRRWMLVDAGGRFISQRNYPPLAKFRAELVGEDGLRILRIADEAVIADVPHARPATAPTTPVTVWDDTFYASLVSTDEELGRRLGVPGARLVYMNAQSSRPVDARYARAGETVSFADGYPYLIATTGSLTDLSARHGDALDVRRFRPNIVVETDRPFAEDAWESLKIGEHRFTVPKPCARCIMITHAPETGERDLSVLAHLASYRKRENKVLFGVNALWSGGSGLLKVGDPVRLLS